jgi:catechol 2,3-dioxygenase-like lactoylglutathione lyase family enzyme
MKPKPKYSGGRNIAMRVPAHLYDATVQFYAEVLGLKRVERHSPAVVFEFGNNQLWVDSVAALSQSEVWLELVTDDLATASEHLRLNNIVRRDEIDPLPEGFQAFWISNPASIIHLVCKQEDMM